MTPRNLRNRRTYIESLEPRIAPATIIVTSLLDDNGAGRTLREAIVEANATPATDTIVFAASLFPVGATGEIALNGTEIPITESLKIVGPGAGKLIIDAGNLSRIFKITDGTATVKAVSISGLSMVEGNAGALKGGAIISDETLALSNVVVAGSTTTGNGGGIFVDTTGKVSVKASIVSGNSAGGGGGGMYLRAAAITVSGCTITGNTAGTDGGGLYARILTTGTGDILIENSRIIGNTAGSEGGGAGLDNDRELAGVQKGKVIVRNTIISGNSAGAEGGGLYLDDGFVLLDRVQISNNSAARGGGIGDDSSDALTIKSSSVTNNRATDAAGEGGGGLFIEGDSRVNIISSIISGNSSASDGGGISAGGSTVVVKSSTVSGNTAADDGGGLHAFGGSVLTLDSASFLDNRADRGGGGLHTQGLAADAVKLTISNSLFRGNVADSGGGVDTDATGAQDIGGGEVRISNTKFIANTATGSDGGGLYLRSTAAIVITGGLMTHNAASDDGGGIAVRGGVPGVRILGTLIRDNIAYGDDGGGIAIFTGGQLILSRTTSVMYNAAASEGGGIVNVSGSPVLLNGSKVVANTAPIDPQISGPFTP
jgi:hypothetical protein